jgi:hypothetical protein
MRVAGVFLAILCAAGIARAQDYLNCHFVPGWEQSGPIRQYTADNISDFKDGHAQGYLTFGFVRMERIDCKSAAKTLSIDVAEMRDAVSAYGMFDFNRDPNVPVAKIGMGGQILRQRASFAKGKYYVQIVITESNRFGDYPDTLERFAASVQQRLEGQDTVPVALEWLPNKNLAFARLVPANMPGL